MQNDNVLGYNGSNVHEQQQNERKHTQNSNNNGSQQQRSFTQPLIVDETKQYMDGLMPEDDDEEADNNNKDQLQNISGDGSKKLAGKKTRGRVKIKMEFIQNKLRRYTTFSKRKTGIMKKAYELSTLTGTQVMLLVASETGHVYTFATRKLQPMITSESGKALIQTCLNSPDPSPASSVQQMQQSEGTLSQESSPPTQVGIPVANVSRATLSQNNIEGGELHYQTEDNDVKTSHSSSSTIGAINYVNQSGQSFPMTAYITPAATQNQTTIFTPSINAGNQNSPTVQIGTPTVVTHHQPQILSGQLQLHRIHPQNILLTGSSPVLQSNPIILNQTNSGQSVVLDSGQAVQTTRHASTQHQDVITLVHPDQLSSSPRLQMVYTHGDNAVIYAPATGTTIKRVNSGQNGNDMVTLQHTPVIQTPAISQE